MYPADLLIYYISAAVILLASLPMTVNVSLPHNNTGRASVLYNLAAIHFPSATCTNPVNSELHVIHQSALQCNWRRWMQCVHFLTAVCYSQPCCPEACLQAHYAVFSDNAGLCRGFHCRKSESSCPEMFSNTAVIASNFATILCSEGTRRALSLQ